MIFVVRQNLGRQRRARDVHQVTPERLLVLAVVHGVRLQRLARRSARLAETLDDGHGMHLLVDELFRLTQQLAGEHDDGGGAVAHLVVLRLADVHKHLRGGVVDVYGLQDGGTVVGDGDLVALAHGEEDLVHALGPQCGLHQVRDRHRAHEGGEAGVLALLLRGALLKDGGPPLPIMLMVAVGCLSMMGEDRRKTEEAR